MTYLARCSIPSTSSRHVRPRCPGPSRRTPPRFPAPSARSPRDPRAPVVSSQFRMSEMNTASPRMPSPLDTAGMMAEGSAPGLAERARGWQAVPGGKDPRRRRGAGRGRAGWRRAGCRPTPRLGPAPAGCHPGTPTAYWLNFLPLILERPPSSLFDWQNSKDTWG